MLAKALLIGFILSFSQGCKGDCITGLNVQRDAKPIFIFSGGGWLTGFTVRNIGTKGRPAQGDDITWEIKSEKSMDGARHVADIGTIQYGVVPTGYRQVRPVRASIIGGAYISDYGLYNRLYLGESRLWDSIRESRGGRGQ